MSDALKVLEEIEAARTPGDWEAVLPGDARGQPVPYYPGVVALVSHSPQITIVTRARSTRPEEWPANAQLIAMAPLLARLVRSVAEAECDLIDPSWSKTCPELTGIVAEGWCWPCWLRRELSGVAR